MLGRVLAPAILFLRTTESGMDRLTGITDRLVNRTIRLTSLVRPRALGQGKLVNIIKGIMRQIIM